MGGDGGVIASNRRYMRGAGTADHTGDGSGGASRRQQQNVQDDPQLVRHQAARTMQYCALSQKPLFSASAAKGGRCFANGAIVVCPYGRLYLKEAAVEALLKRKQQQQTTGGNDQDRQQDDLLGRHIRGLKDLREARFQLSASSSSGGSEMNNSEKSVVVVPTCPITGRELNGQVPAYVLQPASSKMKADDSSSTTTTTFNVISEHGLKMLSDQTSTVEDEYGLRLQDKWRLAPPPAALKEIQQVWEEKMLQDKQKKKKKRKRGVAAAAAESTTADDKSQNKTKLKKASSISTGGSNKKQATVSEAARARVSAAVKSNEVLSSLFTTSASSKKQQLS